MEKNAIDSAVSGLVRCDCGCKYWVNLKCVDCGASLAEYPEQLSEDRHAIAFNLKLGGDR